MTRVFRVELLRVCGSVVLDVPVDEAKVLEDGTKIPSEGAADATRMALAWVKANEAEARRLCDESQRTTPGCVDVEFMPRDAELLQTKAEKEARLARSQKALGEESTEL